MAGWRDRGYVQDSDEEEDSQNQIFTGLRVSGKAVNLDDTRAIQSDELHNVEARDSQDQRGGLRVESVQDGALSTNAGGECNSMATLLAQREKENAPSTAVGQDVHNTGNAIPDTHADIDELQQDHYRTTSIAQVETKTLKGAHHMEARSHSSQVLPDTIFFSSSLSSSPLSQVLGADLGTPSDSGTQKSTSGVQNGDGESSTDGSPMVFGSNSERNTKNQPDDPVADQAYGFQRAPRNLRRRNPIQLHPYAVESEHYRQTLKARGVKPLRIAQMEAEAAKALEEDSQNIDFDGEETQLLNSDSEQPAPLSSSPIYPHGSLKTLPQDKRDIFVFGDDELPDVSTLLSHSTLGYVGNGRKRRKIAKATSTAFRMPPGVYPDQKSLVPENEARSALTDDDVLFDVPPSPPQSVSQTPPETDRSALPAFRMPRRLSPTTLPTPITSSGPRRRRQFKISEDKESQNHYHRTRRTSDIDGDSTDPELTSNEEANPRQFQRAQRRIRGVLPASWLKLDMNTQKGKPTVTRRVLSRVSPQRDIAQRGIARMVPAPEIMSPDTPNRRHEIEVLSDDEGLVSERDKLPQQIRNRQLQNHMLEDSGEEELVVRRWGEAAEDDHIDAMLPTATRAFHSRKRNKRQIKIEDFHSRSRVSTHGISKKASSEGIHQGRTVNEFDKCHKWRPEFQPPRLGILDAPLTQGSPRDCVPQFLKVASRTARSRHDKGRHSPSRKFVRLATREDDNDANDTLRDWREGTIIPLANDEINDVLSRQPLKPRSANSCVPSRTVENERSSRISKLPASRATSGRPHVRPRISRKLQTSLDHLIERRHGEGHDINEPNAPSWLQKAIEKPKRQGQIVSSLQAVKDSRPAMLESAREDADRANAQAMFHRDLARVNHFDDDSGLPGVLVRRFFGNDGIRRSNNSTMKADCAATGQDATEVFAIAKTAVPNKRRKRRPQRVNVPEMWPKEPSAPVILEEYPNESVNCPEAPKENMLVGLGPFGTRYTATFDIDPLPTGTCFNAQTLLGSGRFAKALKPTITPIFERPRGHSFLKLQDRNLRWGPWNDTVSSELGEVFDVIRAHAVADELGVRSGQTDEKILHLQGCALEYFSYHLSFLDPVDRVAYVLRCKALLSTLVADLIGHHAVSKNTNHQSANDLQMDIQISTLTVTLTHQLLQISKHELVPSELQDEVGFLVRKAVHHTLDLSLMQGLEPFETCLSNLRHRNADYRVQDHYIEAFVVARHVLGQDPDSKTSIWVTLLKAVPTRSSDGIFDITLAEQIWKQLFILLPFLELDAQGVVETGRRFKVPVDNWTLAKRLISPALEASLRNPHGQPPSFNSYCRATFARCLHLINGWGWRRCELIIGILFDYFARNGLAHLRGEHSKGTPVFLERLDKNPTLTIDHDDTGFHILLKIIGSGLSHMRQLYSEKKIRDVVWRLMPNHGRSHPKEEAIRQEHLDALRNHHDLLCTLYWASPPSCRPPLTIIRNLVNLETSHREACHINIRAWFNLVKFQLSTDEPISDLEPFAEWHNHLLAQVLRQHSLARTEAEDQVKSAQSVGEVIVSKEILETTIARNQRQVEAILSDALVCLQLAINVAQIPKAASTLLSTALAGVFDLFDASGIRAHKPVIQALDVLIACASKFSGSRNENDESQDYGDWSAFEDDSLAIPIQENTTSPFMRLQEPLRHLLWNCFGADLVPDDALLLKLIDGWVIVAQVLVRDGLRSWTDYLGRFGNDCWSSLRDTEQTRKFSVYYLATLLERDSTVYHDHKTFFLMSWVCSLVERESLLKFQHRLMSALLSVDPESLLLQNLPFSKDAANGRYQITASDFSDRRLSLISSVLSNMRLSLEHAVLQPVVIGNELRQELRDLLKHLMATMKRNYQELGHGSNVKGTYVDFVHRVIEFLQQYASTIYPIDRFFTDNSAFPLPATDPTYVVGQLKSYGLRLQDARTPKQLVVFLQSVSERAAIDGQQPYLFSQLHAAMSNAFEDGASSTPTLRAFLVKNIVPAYIELAFSTASGWILAMPHLQALQKVFGELLNDLDGANPSSVAAVASTIAVFLDSVRQSLENSIRSDESISRDAGTLRIMSACYAAISALLPVLDYIVRLPGPTLLAIDTIKFFKSFAEYASAVLHGDRDAGVSNIDHTERTSTETSISDTRRFATQELKDTLTRCWVRHDDQYYVTRGSMRREVVVDMGLYEEQKAQLLTAFREFFETCRRMPALSEGDDHILVRRQKKLLGADELFC